MNCFAISTALVWGVNLSSWMCGPVGEGGADGG